ncbi:MAG: FHA domain-containing protein [Dehalococcoidia bacterium]
MTAGRSGDELVIGEADLAAVPRRSQTPPRSQEAFAKPPLVIEVDLAEVCPIDLTPVHTDFLQCAGCKVIYHEACFRSVGRCATPGCKGEQASAAGAVEEDEDDSGFLVWLASARATRGLLLGLLASLVVGAVLGPLAFALQDELTPMGAAVLGGAAYGAIVGLVLCLDEGLTSRSPAVAFMGLLIGVPISAAAGAGSGALGQAVFDAGAEKTLLIPAWALFGAGIGLAQGAARRSLNGAMFGLVGGALAGAAGGAIAVAIVTGSEGVSEAERSTAPALLLPGLIGLCLGFAAALSAPVVLRVESGRMKGKEVLIDRGLTLIGSSPWRTQFCIADDDTVGGVHARLVLAESLVISAVDGQPIEVNGRRIEQARLQPGDRVRIGQTVLAVGGRGRSA